MIVSDSTTLIILMDLDRWELLGDLFDRVIIPEAVYRELTVGQEVHLPGWITVETVSPSAKLETLNMLLDPGESEAIALAIEKDMGLIIDEKKGRKIAMREGIAIIGLLGVVYLNIRRGHLTIDQARTFIDEALAHGYRIAPSLIEAMFASVEADRKGDDQK